MDARFTAGRWEVVVAGTVLGRVYPVLGGKPDRWTVALPPDFVWCIHDVTRRCAASRHHLDAARYARTIRVGSYSKTSRKYPYLPGRESA